MSEEQARSLANDLEQLRLVREDLEEIALGLHSTGDAGDHHAAHVIQKDIERLDRAIEHTKARLGNAG